MLLLRLCLGLTLIYFGITEPSAENLIAAAGGILLLAGLWTPVAGIVVALDQVWIALSLSALRREDTWIRIFLATLAVSVAMLGPGAWSADARLFGRKRIDIDRLRGRRPSP